MAPYEIAIERVKRLFRERSDPGFWSDNIIQASRDLETKHDWSRFYSYITNPRTYDPAAQIVTLDDMIDPLPAIPAYEDCFEVKEYKNGPLETIIHVRRKDSQEDDEKKEE